MKFNEFTVEQQVYLPGDIAGKIVKIYNLPESGGICVKLEVMLSGPAEEEALIIITEQERETLNYR